MKVRLGHLLCLLLVASVPGCSPSIQHRFKIEKGMTYSEAMTTLASSGSVISSEEELGIGVGFASAVGDRQFSHSWWVLPDKTLVLIHGERPEESGIVTSLVVGPRGKGYTGKLHWFDAAKPVEVLEIP